MTLTIRLPDDLYEKLRKAAFDQHTSMNALIIAAIRDQQET
jgi:predicted HicB family RNase H-like nuclease